MSPPKFTRWRLTKILLSLSTVAFFTPAVVNFVLQFSIKNFTPLVMLTAAEWITIVTLILTLYNSSNVMLDHIYTRNGNGKKPPVEGEKPPKEDEGD